MSRFAGYIGGGMLGRMVFRAGVHSLENTLQARSEESQASQTGDVAGYQKAQAKEFGGFLGGIREWTQHQISQRGKPLGINVADPEQEEATLARQASDEEQEKAHTKEVLEGVKAREAEKKEQIRQANETQIATAPDEYTGKTDKINQDLAAKLAQAETISGGNTVEQGFGSGAEGKKKQDAYVSQMVAMAAQQANAEQHKLDVAERSAVNADRAEGQEAQLRLAGDEAGAKKVAFDQELARKSEEAHKRSQHEGDVFDSETAPARVAG